MTGGRYCSHRCYRLMWLWQTTILAQPVGQSDLAPTNHCVDVVFWTTLYGPESGLLLKLTRASLMGWCFYWASHKLCWHFHLRANRQTVFRRQTRYSNQCINLYTHTFCLCSSLTLWWRHYLYDKATTLKRITAMIRDRFAVFKITAMNIQYLFTFIALNI